MILVTCVKLLNSFCSISGGTEQEQESEYLQL